MTPLGLEGGEDADAVGDGAASDVGGEGDGVELVRDARVQVKFHGDAGPAELGRVGEVLVAEGVELADLDVGGGSPVASWRRAGAAVAGTSGLPAASPSSAGHAVRLSS